MDFTTLICLITCFMAFELTEASDSSTCPNPELKTREQWGSTVVNTAPEVGMSPGMVFIGQTGGLPCSNFLECRERVQRIQEYDIKSNNATDIRSHFLIGGDGIVYEGRGWNRKGEFPSSHPNELGIAFIGNFIGNDSAPVPPIVANTARNFILCGVNKRKIQYYFSAYTIYDLSCDNSTEYNGILTEVKKWSRYQLGGPLKNC